MFKLIFRSMQSFLNFWMFWNITWALIRVFLTVMRVFLEYCPEVFSIPFAMPISKLLWEFRFFYDQLLYCIRTNFRADLISHIGKISFFGQNYFSHVLIFAKSYFQRKFCTKFRAWINIYARANARKLVRIR